MIQTLLIVISKVTIFVRETLGLQKAKKVLNIPRVGRYYSISRRSHGSISYLMHIPPIVVPLPSGKNALIFRIKIFPRGANGEEKFSGGAYLKKWFLVQALVMFSLFVFLMSPYWFPLLFPKQQKNLYGVATPNFAGDIVLTSTPFPVSTSIFDKFVPVITPTFTPSKTSTQSFGQFQKKTVSGYFYLLSCNLII